MPSQTPPPIRSSAPQFFPPANRGNGETNATNNTDRPPVEKPYTSSNRRSSERDRVLAGPGGESAMDKTAKSTTDVLLDTALRLALDQGKEYIRRRHPRLNDAIDKTFEAIVDQRENDPQGPLNLHYPIGNGKGRDVNLSIQADGRIDGQYSSPRRVIGMGLSNDEGVMVRSDTTKKRTDRPDAPSISSRQYRLAPNGENSAEINYSHSVSSGPDRLDRYSTATFDLKDDKLTKKSAAKVKVTDAFKATDEDRQDVRDGKVDHYSENGHPIRGNFYTLSQNHSGGLPAYVYEYLGHDEYSRIRL